MSITTFQELSLSAELQSAIADMGFTAPSPIQQQTIPFLIEGRDLIGQAQTGTGKTAAFALPILQRLDVTKKVPQALILCPTRELAVQVAEEFKKLAKYMEGVFVLAVFGGDSMERQLSLLRKGVHIVVGTPGRVQDHIQRGTLKLDNVKVAVLDEADEMLNMGFVEDIEQILQMLPEEKQTVFFSATMPAPILQLTKRFQRNPQLVRVVSQELTGANIEQYHYVVFEEDKIELITRLIEMHDLKLMLTFCNTKQRVDEVVEELQERGFAAEGLHGDMNQSLRNAVMNRFRRGIITMLVATDVAARGIDVNDIGAVFNYDTPLDPEYYVHRIGRTGRAGKTGYSFTFVMKREIMRLKAIERYAKTSIPKGEIPAIPGIIAKRHVMLKKQLLSQIATLEIVPQTEKILDELLEVSGGDLRKIAASMLQMQMESLLPKNNFDENRRFQAHNETSRSQEYGNGGGGGGGKYGQKSSNYGDRNRYSNSRGGYGDKKPSYGGDKKPSYGGGSGYAGNKYKDEAPRVDKDGNKIVKKYDQLRTPRSYSHKKY